MKPVRFGVVGCGVIGTKHLEAARQSPLVDVVAVADLRQDAVESAARQYQVPAAYASGEALLADPDVAAVVLAMPACARTELAVKAFKAGKHVLTEKPVAMNAAEVEQMIEARGTLVAACCSSRYRFLASSEAAARFIATGALGELRVVWAHFIAPAGKPPERTPPPWRLSRSLNGGGILMNWGCYDLDYLLGIIGWTLKPRLALAGAWRVGPQLESYVAPGSDAEAHVAALVLCEGGTVIQYQRGEYVVSDNDAAWQIIGSNGALQLTMGVAAGEKIVFNYLSASDGVQSETVWEGEEGWDAVHAGPIHDLAAAIRGRKPPKTSLEQALVVQKITDAIYASAERGTAAAIC